MKLARLSLALAIVSCACVAAWGQDAEQKDLKIAECISRHLNEKFIARRNDREFGVGIIADPHWNEAGAKRSIRTKNIWHAESLDLSIIVGDASIWPAELIKEMLADAPKKFSWPYRGKKTIIQSSKQQTRTWPDKPRPAPPWVVAMGNHEMHTGKRFYVDGLWPGAVADESLWIHDKTHYQNKAPGANGNGNYVFFSFNFGRLHFVALDAWAWRPGARNKPNSIPPHQLKWLEADLQAHRHMETVILNHSPVATGDPALQLRNRLQLMGVLKQYPHVKWYFAGHHHGYAWAKWAHINVFRVSSGTGDDVRYAPGALMVKGDKTTWLRWGGAYWYVQGIKADYNFYHRSLVPDKPSTIIKTAIPDPPARTDKVAPAAAANLRLRKVEPKRAVRDSIALQWDAAEGADYYDVHRDGKRIGGSLYPRFTDYDRKGGASHKYAVYARDIAGNQSAEGASGTFACPAAKDASGERPGQ